jgi:hypothetical protein
MDARLDLIHRIKRERWAQGTFLGLLHLLIGRRIELGDGSLVSNGLTWRELAGLLKKARWDKAAAKELPLEGVALPPREREKYWYAVIAHAGVASPAAAQAGDRLASQLRQAGYSVSSSPQTAAPHEATS